MLFFVLVWLPIWTGAPLWAAEPATANGAKPARGRIVVLGDSITAGLGLNDPADAWPARLQQKIDAAGLPFEVVNAGVSGDTTAGGLARVDFSVRKDTDLAIVALGGNDLLQGLDTGETRANLDGIVKKLQARHIRVLVAGIGAPPQIGGGYARDFNALFASVAKARGAVLYPDLLDGVGRNPALKQGDGIHPNARGAAIIAGKLAPVVAKALAAHR